MSEPKISDHIQNEDGMDTEASRKLRHLAGVLRARVHGSHRKTVEQVANGLDELGYELVKAAADRVRAARQPKHPEDSLAGKLERLADEVAAVEETAWQYDELCD